MRKRPFLLLACMFGTGIYIQSAGTYWLLLPVLCFILVIFLLEKKENRGMWFVLLLAFSLVTGYFHMYREMLYREQYMPVLKDGQVVRLMGEITRIERKNYSVNIQLTDCVLEQSSKRIPCNDILVYASTDDFSIGQILILNGKIKLFEPARNEGNFDFCAYYQSMKIDFGVKLQGVEKVLKKGNWYRLFLLSLRKRLRSTLGHLGDEDGVLSTMLLGEKENLNPETKSLYQLAGISHILAISGLHVSLLGMGFYRLLRKKWGYFICCGVTGVFMYSYGVMTGSSVSTKRAVGMLFIFLLGDYLGRSYDMLSALGAIGIVMLWDNPFLISNTAFLLSVAAVVGVGVFGELLEKQASSREKMNGNTVVDFRKDSCDRWIGRIWNQLRESLCMSLGIQLMTLPMIAYSYFEIPTYGIVLNFIVLALVKYLVAFGGVAALLGLWTMVGGALFFFPCRGILFVIETLSQWMVRIPGARLLLGRPSVAQIVLYYCFLIIGFFLMKAAFSVKKLVVIYVFLLGVLLCHFQRGLEVDLLDVGQGDGAYIRTEDGLHLFVDGGSSDVKQVGQYRMLPFFKSRAIGEIDYWFLSHGDEDHTNGFLELLEMDYQVRHLVMSKECEGDERMREILRLAKAKGVSVITVSGGNVLQVKSARFYIWGADTDGTQNSNDQSLVFCYEDEGFRGVFGGDISSEMERAIVTHLDGKKQDVSLYKVNHHGSKYSSSKDWMSSLMPEISVVSCSKMNRYGHPSKEAMDNISEVGSKLYYTMNGGQIRVKRKDEEIIVKEFVEKRT